MCAVSLNRLKEGKWTRRKGLRETFSNCCCALEGNSGEMEMDNKVSFGEHSCSSETGARFQIGELTASSHHKDVFVALINCEAHFPSKKNKDASICIAYLSLNLVHFREVTLA